MKPINWLDHKILKLLHGFIDWYQILTLSNVHHSLRFFEMLSNPVIRNQLREGAWFVGGLAGMLVE
jgi:hypothetical protein